MWVSLEMGYILKCAGEHADEPVTCEPNRQTNPYTSMRGFPFIDLQRLFLGSLTVSNSGCMFNPVIGYLQID